MLQASEGLRRYMAQATHYPWPSPNAWEITWHAYGAQLLHYVQESGSNKPPLCLVPSLINRAYILDLPPHSLCNRLAQHYDIYILDWGTPSHAMAAWDSQHYVTHIVLPAWKIISEQHARPFHAVGHCMGGLMALAAAAESPELLASLSLLSTPWHFTALPVSQYLQLSQLSSIAEWLDQTSLVPPQLIQPWFYVADPSLLGRKYAAFATMQQGSPEAEQFMTLEGWVHDGVPLTRALAKECLLEWIGRNRPLLPWRDRLMQWELPTLVISGSNDRIVPHTASQPLASQLAHSEHRLLQTGHVRMVAGESMPTLAKTLENWLDFHG